MTHNSNRGYDTCADFGVFISRLLHCWIFFEISFVLCSVTSWLVSQEDVFVPDISREMEMPMQKWGGCEREKSGLWQRHCHFVELPPGIKKILSSIFCSQTKLVDVYACCDSEANIDTYTDILTLTWHPSAVFGPDGQQSRDKPLPWEDVAITFSRTSQRTGHQKYIEKPENLVKNPKTL